MSTQTKLARARATDNLQDNILWRIPFKEPPPSSIICFICEKVLKRPTQFSCGHRSCKRCYEQIESNENGEKYCPDDKELIEMAFADVSALTEIMFLLCFCVNMSDGCTWKGVLYEIEDHLNTCEFKADQRCPWESVYCDFTGNKKEIEKHLKDDVLIHNSLFSCYLSQIIDHFATVRNGMDEVKDMSKKLQSKISVDQVLVVAKKELNEMLRSLETNALMVADLRSWYAQLSRNLDMLEANKSLSGLKDFQTRLDNLIASVEKQQIRVNEITSGGIVDMVTLKQKKKNMIDKIHRLEKTNKQHGSQLQDTDLKIRMFQSTTFDGNYIWKLDNIKNRFVEANSGRITELYTPPLYTSAYGYKFSAKVLLNGDPMDRGSSSPHIAFYFVLMQGDYDEILRFPFPFPINITLLNLSKKENLVYQLVPDKKPHYSKPVKELNPAIGFSKFCSHDSLYTDGFVRDDAIYFKIELDKSGCDNEGLIV